MNKQNKQKTQKTKKERIKNKNTLQLFVLSFSHIDFNGKQKCEVKTYEKKEEIFDVKSNNNNENLTD